MEGELTNFVMVWASVLACLCYCHTIAKFFPKGTIRFLTIFPVFCLFIYLPLYLNTINLGCTSTFFISWLTNFKLLLFAFSTGPLYSHPPIPLTRFILLACLPIKIKHPNQDSKKDINKKSEKYPYLDIAKNGQKYDLNGESKKGHKSLSNYAIKLLLFSILIDRYIINTIQHHRQLLLLLGLTTYIIIF